MKIESEKQNKKH